MRLTWCIYPVPARSRSCDSRSSGRSLRERAARRAVLTPDSSCATSARDRVVGGGDVDLGTWCLGEDWPVSERAVVGHQSRPVVSWSSRPTAAPSRRMKLFGQQRVHAGVVAGLARAFVVGGLFSADIDMFAVSPTLRRTAEFQPVASRSGAGVGERHAGYADLAVGDSSLHHLRCRSLGLQDASKVCFLMGCGS